MEITFTEYWEEVSHIAREVWKEAREYDREGEEYDILHEWIDSHSWIIYTYRAAQIMAHTDSPEAYWEELGGDVPGDSWCAIVTVLAFFAFRRDVLDSAAWSEGEDSE